MFWMHHLDYFQGQITKYVMRHRDKGGIEDLKKAQHFLAKYIELLEKDKTPVVDAPLGSHLNYKSAFFKAQAYLDEHAAPEGAWSMDPHTGAWDFKTKYSYFRVFSEPAVPVKEVKPTGWVRFIFEGAHAASALYTCRDCRKEVTCPVEDFPGRFHACPVTVDSAGPNRNYVDQG